MFLEYRKYLIKMKVNVIGLGYIGLPTAMMLASHGIEVVGTDYDQDKVADLLSGKVTFKEQGLDELLEQAQKGGIQFTTQYQQTDMYVISVPTPYDKISKKIDVSYVVNAVREVLQVCQDKAILVIESTVSPGTIDHAVRPLLSGMEKRTGKQVHLVHAPERVIPGNMVYELVHNNRTIGAKR